MIRLLCIIRCNACEPKYTVFFLRRCVLIPVVDPAIKKNIMSNIKKYIYHSVFN